MLPTEATVPSQDHVSVVEELGVLAGRFSNLYALLVQAPAAIAIVRGPDHLYDFSNAENNRILGKDPTGLAMRDAFPDIVSQGYDTLLDSVRETGQRVELAEARLLLGTPEGGEREIFAKVVFEPLRGPRDEIDGVFIVGFDVTDHVTARRRLETAERAEREAEERLRLALESARFGTWDYDLEADVLRFDARAKELVGIPPDQDATFEIFLEHLHPDDREPTRQNVTGVLAGTDGGRYEMEARTADGRCWIAGRGQVLFDEATGRPVRFIGTILDITEQKRGAAERERLLGELTAAVRARDDFISIASHELRTPLSALQLQIEGLQRGAGKDDGAPEKLAGRLAKAMALVGRLERLISELLEVSRIQGGKRLTIRPEQMDLGELVEEVVDRFAPAFARAGCAVSLVTHPGLIGNWDRFRLDQVLSNLLENATKYASGCPIDVTIERLDGRALLSIRDHGIGISEEDQARVFERFERAVAPREYGGFGLGLWIARQIVEAHHGRIAVSSTPGAGTTFSVELPL
jgi:PAS domain S-box-containing protein